MIMEPKQTTRYNYFIIFSLLCSCYVTDMIKNVELHLLVVIILFKIEFGQAQISVPKIVKPIAENSLYQLLLAIQKINYTLNVHHFNLF